MTQHIITKNYNSLRGFSTASKYMKPSYISDKVINHFRHADGSFSPRRGYQVQSDGIGGLGTGTYENSSSQQDQEVCIHTNGNLYIQKKGSMTISFNDPSLNPNSFISYEIYVDPNNVTDNQQCDFDPYLVIDDSALVNDTIVFLLKKSTSYSGIAIGSGLTNYSGTLSGSPLVPGNIVFTDGTLVIQDDSNGNLIGDIGVGTNSINYSNGSYDVTFSAITGSVTAEYKSTLQTQFSQSMGKGYGVFSPFSITSLISLLNSISGVSVTSTGITNIPASFIEIQEETNISHGKSVTLDWIYWESANRTLPSTFSGLAAQTNSENFRNATFASYEEVIYIATGFDEIQKFDGQTIYRAGMPEGEINSVTPTTVAGNVDAGSHNYYITYEQIDNNGRLVEGVLSDSISASAMAGGEQIDVIVTNLVQGSGWNTNSAIIVGNQVGVTTINVDDGSGGPHSLQIGDKAYFLDGVSSNYVTRNVIAITSSTITIDGSAVNVSNNEVISNNLKINIFRTIVGGTEPFIVSTIPNNSYNSTYTYLDNFSDATIQNNRRYVSPARLNNPPPKTSIVIAFEDQLIFTDDPNNEDYVWFSESKQPEYVSTAFNNFIVPSNNDDITGAGVSGSTLIIFKENSIYSVNGDLNQSQFEVTSVAPGSNIGCVSHHTIKPIGGVLYFLYTNGLYSIVETQLYPTDEEGNPIPLSIPIDEIFRSENVIENERYVLKRSTAINYTKDHQYLLFLPAEEKDGERFSNNHSRVFCFDYLGKNWFEWTRINASGGWYIINDNLYWQDRTVYNGKLRSKTYKQHRKYRLIDQVDHVTPIRSTYESGWEDLGQPRVRKKFIRCALLFDEISSLFQQNIPNLCFISYKNWIDNRISTYSDIMQKIQSTDWNVGGWNFLDWSGYQDSFTTVSLKSGSVCKSIKIGLKLNQINTTYKLQGFQLEISNDFGRSILR